MKMYLSCLPLHNIEQNEVQTSIETIENENSELTLKTLQNELQSDSRWIQDEFEDIKVTEFLQSYLSAPDQQAE